MNLSVKIGNLELKNPVMGASGTFGFGREYEDFLDVNEIGAIVTKGVTPKPRAGNPGVRIAETPSGMLNCIGLENPGVDAFIYDILPKIKKYNTAVIVNISAGSVEEYAEMAWRLDIDGVDAVEVNISCPNVKEGGIVFGTDPKAAAAVTHAGIGSHARKGTDLGRCLVAGAHEAQINALLTGNAQLVGGLFGEIPQFQTVRLGHVRETRAEALVVGADERVRTHHVDEVGEEHQGARLKLPVDAAAGIGQHHLFHSQQFQDIERVADFLHRVAFIKVEPSFQRIDLFLAQLALDAQHGLRPASSRVSASTGILSSNAFITACAQLHCPAAFPVLQSGTGACLCSFCRTRWPLWGNRRCRPCSGCSVCPRPACRFPAGYCSGGTAPRTCRIRYRHPLPGRHPPSQKSDRTPGLPGRS